MTDRTLVHVRVDYVDALESKKNILNIEKSVLEVNEVALNFSSLRTLELKNKLKFYRKVREILNIVKELKKNLPEGKIPKRVREMKAEGKTKEKSAKKTKEKRGVELQLRDIQEKLAALQR